MQCSLDNKNPLVSIISVYFPSLYTPHAGCNERWKGLIKILEFGWQVLRPTRHKTVHFRDVLPSQSLGVVLEKLNLRQQKQTTQEQNSLS